MKTDPARAEQDEEILRLRCSGLSLRAIGVRVGLSHQGVSDRITAALGELVTPAAEELRQLELERLDRLTVAAVEVLERRHVTVSHGKIICGEDGRPLIDDGPVLGAVDRLTKLSESRRKLLGLDAREPLSVVLERRLNDDAELVTDALGAALDVLDLDPERQALAVAAATAKLTGEEPPARPVPAVPGPEPEAAQAGMEQRLRELTADEPDVDVDALLAEFDDGQEQGSGSGGR